MDAISEVTEVYVINRKQGCRYQPMQMGWHGRAQGE